MVANDMPSNELAAPAALTIDPFVLDDDDHSDSDWLDIASNRESDDTDSVSSRDSDLYDVDPASSRSISRRSSMSIGSSRDGEADVWDGFTDDSSDESPIRGLLAAIDCPIMGPVSDGEVDNDNDELDDADSGPHGGDERQVIDALDQSMMTTLSSGPPTVHNSVRDLRLSFPDPLTSSCEGSLSSSYTNVSPVADQSISAEEPERPAGIKEDSSDPAVLEKPVQDVPAKPSLEAFIVPRVLDVGEAPPAERLRLSMYGSGTSSPSKWMLATKLVEQAGQAHGLVLSAVLANQSDTIHFLLFQRPVCLLDQPVVVKIVDKTSMYPLNPIELDRVNIVYLPLPHGTTFTNIRTWRPQRFIAAALPDASIKAPCLSSKDTPWHEFGLTRPCPLRGLPDDYVLTLEDVSSLSHEAVRDIWDPLAETVAWLIGLFFCISTIALLSPLFLGINLGPTAQSTMATNWQTPTAVLAVQTEAHSLSVYTGPTDFTRPFAAVDHSASLSSLSSSIPAAQETPTSSSDGPSRAELRQSANDLALYVSAVSHIGSMEVAKTADSFTSLSIRAVDSLSQLMDVTVKVLVDTLSKDLRDLVEALDALSNAILRQTSDVVMASREKSRTVRDLIQYRHQRAKGRATELAALGGRIISRAGDVLAGRSVVAHRKARSWRDTISHLEAWKTYRKVHGNWHSRLGRHKQEREDEGRRSRSVFFG